MSDLKAFKRRATAERCGLRRIYLEASTQLDAADLGRLVLHLRETKPVSRRVKAKRAKRSHWQPAEAPFELTRDERRDLAIDLLDAGTVEGRIIDVTGMSARTLRRLKQSGCSHAEKRRANPHRNGAKMAKPSARVGLPILAFWSAGTPGEIHREIEELLMPIVDDEPWPNCNCAERGSRPVPVKSDPGLCRTCGCRFKAALTLVDNPDADQGAPIELGEALNVRDGLRSERKRAA